MTHLVGGNPLTPEWFSSSYDALEIPAGFYPVQWDYAVTIANDGTPLDSLSNVLQLHRDSEFLWTGLHFANVVGTDGVSLLVRIDDGRQMMPDGSFLSSVIAGPVFPGIRLAAGGQLIFDALNSSVSSRTLQVVVKGYKLYRLADGAPSPSLVAPRPYVPVRNQYSRPPAGWKDLRYDIPVRATLAAGAQLTVTVAIETDADFYLRGWLGTAPMYYTITDAFGRLLTGGDFPLAGANFVGNDRPRPVFPELLCPAGSVLAVQVRNDDVDGQAAAAVLSGVKRYRIV